MLLDDCELCQLCKGKVSTKLYFENERFKIVDCSTCKIPMLVYCENHGMLLSLEELKEMTSIIERLFPNSYLRFQQRRIKDHFHIHILRKAEN